MKQKKFLFVINPISGGRDKSLLPQKIEIFSKRHAVEKEIMETTGEDDIGRMEERCEEFKPDVLVACGGDGTVSLVAGIVKRRQLTLGIIPCGSANGMARELSIPSDFDRALELLVELEPFSCDMIKVDEHFCLHLADVGLNAGLIKRFERSNRRGWWGYVREFRSQWREKHNVEYRIKTKSRSKEKKIKGFVLVIANARLFGTGACVNPRGSLTDGKFEVVVLKPHGLLSFFGTTLRAFFGSISESPFAKIYSCSEAVIKINSKEPLQVDGEFISETDRVKAFIVKGAINVIGHAAQQPGALENILL